MRCLYSIAVNVPSSQANANGIIFASQVVDPLNPSNRHEPHLPFASRFQKQSILEMPAAPEQAWAKVHPEVPKGKVINTSLDSQILGSTEELSVYTPADYNEGHDNSLFILFDRLEYTTLIPAPTILDNLIAQKKIPATVAVLIEFPEPQDDTRTKQLACNPKFTEFLKSELLPWVKKNYHVKIDPKHIVVGGSSRGGLAAACAGLHQPDTFRNILSQSGSFWWTQASDAHYFDEKLAPDDPDNELGDAIKMFRDSPKLPLRFYMEAGSLEIDLDGKDFSLLMPSRHLRDVLMAKGYEVHWHQFRGGHDYLSWRGTLADGLMALSNERK